MGSLGRKDKSGRHNTIAALGAQLSRRRTLAGAASALAAAFGLTACAEEPPLDALAEPVPQTDTQLSPDTEVRRALGDAPDLVVAGQRLNPALLRKFYERHRYAPVWASRQQQADLLIQAVLRAPDHGLDPGLFHAALLRQPADLSPLDRDLILSDAFLSYADALARGAVPVERRKADEVLAPEPVDIPAALDQAAASADPASVIEALAPATPTYDALREALKQQADTPPGDEAATNRRRTIQVNLERQRWLPRPLPPDRVWVNVADERLVMYRANQPAFTTRVVVGEDVEHNQSPEFRATIDASFYNPPWVIPADIATAEILPKLTEDPDYLTRNKMVMLANGEVEQLPGPDAGLGLVMFDMPNRFDVYLHDTPEKSVFNRDNRRISHGCIRVQNPRELAALLMDQPLETVDQGIAAGSTTRNALPTPVPVYVVYQTAFLDADGALQFRRDFYNRDRAIWRQLQQNGADWPDDTTPQPLPRPGRRKPILASAGTPFRKAFIRRR